MDDLAGYIPMLLCCGCTFVFVAGVALLIFYLIKNQKKQAWEGKVVDKKHKVSEDYDTGVDNHYYSIVVETVDGKKKTIGLDKKTFDNYQIGDKVVKKQGQLRPEKVS